jgi:hypothetical protein
VSACRAWGAGDLSTIRDLYTEDVTADGGDLWPEGSGPVRGVDRVLETFAAIMSAFESSELIPESVLEVGDTLIVPLLWRGRAGGSHVEQRLVGCYLFRGSRIAGITWYSSLEAAREANGLPAHADPGPLPARLRVATPTSR